MPLESIYETLTEILRDTFNDDDVVASPGLTADQVDGWDSLSHLRLMFAVEKKFSISLTALQIDSLRDVGDLAELIHSKTGASLT
jgi:acyl carrier protein